MTLEEMITANKTSPFDILRYANENPGGYPIRFEAEVVAELIELHQQGRIIIKDNLVSLLTEEGQI